MVAVKIKRINVMIIIAAAILLFTLSAVYAENSTEECLTQSDNDTSISQDINDDILDSNDDTEMLESNTTLKNFIVNQRNFKMYFDNHNVLKNEYGGQIITFDGKFTDKGIITIGSPNTVVTGRNTLFNNTVFCLESSNITLSNINFVLDKSFPTNDYAGILALDDNITIYNCNVNYRVPDGETGFCLYAECGSYEKVNGFNLINNTFNIISENVTDCWVYGAYLNWIDNAVVYGNTINAILPLCAVDWSKEIYGGARMDLVGGFVADTCENLTLSNNNITTRVNHRGNLFPTLDTVLIYACNNAVIENNKIYSEDYITKEGEDNYLQGIDLYISNNVTIIGNQIDMRTTGGSEKMGTAYPIQVTGPSYDVKIAYNHITSINNGPNIGVYSQNFYGPTKIQIISNFINITGKANKHNWALVTGVELQDSDDIVWNNTIIVKNVGEFADENNIYGISYSQNTNNNHTYNIQYNNVITNGKYAILLVGANSLVVNSLIANNILNTQVFSGDDAVFIGNGTNNQVFDNSGTEFKKTMDSTQEPDWIKNHRTVSPKVTIPYAPEYLSEDSDGSGLSDATGNGNMPWRTPGTSNGLNTGSEKSTNDNRKSDVEGTNPEIISLQGSDKTTSPGIGGDSLPSQAAGSQGDAGSSAKNPNAYELESVAKSIDPISPYVLAVIALLLLIVGYKYKDKNEL